MADKSINSDIDEAITLVDWDVYPASEGKKIIDLLTELKHFRETDQTDCYPTVTNDAKYDSGKLHLSYVPSSLIYAVAYIREYGNAKYHDPNNWLDVEWQRYYEALLRHVELFKADPKGYDDESGLPHLWHIACNVAFLCHMLEPMYCEKLGIKVGEQLDFRKISPYFKDLEKECDKDDIHNNN